MATEQIIGWYECDIARDHDCGDEQEKDILYARNAKSRESVGNRDRRKQYTYFADERDNDCILEVQWHSCHTQEVFEVVEGWLELIISLQCTPCSIPKNRASLRVIGSYRLARFPGGLIYVPMLTAFIRWHCIDDKVFSFVIERHTLSRQNAGVPIKELIMWCERRDHNK